MREVEIIVTGGEPEISFPNAEPIELIGKVGKKGEDGGDGTKGDKGDKGDKGNKGDAGDKGDKGDPGESVDIDEIIDLIDDKTKDLTEAIEKIAGDGYITPSEKRILQLEVNSIIAEKPSIIARAELHQLEELKSDYNQAYDDLMLYVGPILNFPDDTTPVVSSVFQQKFNTFYVARAEILKQSAIKDSENAEQVRETLEGVEYITNFWKITLDLEHGVIAAGTMLVGTPSYNNAGMTGVTDQGENSVRFFAGASYQNRNVAPWRVLNNGKMWAGTAQSGWDWGITTPDRFTIRGGLNVDPGGNTSEAGVYRGEYSPQATYYKGNEVTSNGSYWRYVNDTPANGGVPADNTYWDVLAKKGADGDGGEGSKGDPGVGIEYRYRVNGSWETAPAVPSPSDNNPADWTIDTPPFTVGQYLWRISAQRDAEGILKSTWSDPVRETGIPGNKGDRGDQGPKGQSVFKSTVFLRSVTKPPIPTGGTYASPIPTTGGWTDGTPDGDDPLYSTARTFTSDGLAPQSPTWSDTALMAGSVDLDMMWSSVATNPGNPTVNPTNWTASAGSTTKWLAIRKRVNGVEGSWEVSQIKGEKGDDGDKGDKGDKGETGNTGPFVLNRDVWKSDQSYHGGTDYIEMVNYLGKVYYTRTDAGTIAAGTLPTNASKWVNPAITTPSLHADILTALTANIANLVIGQLRSDNGLISLNHSQDNKLIIYHPSNPTQPGIIAGVDTETQQPIIAAYLADGTKVWDLGLSGEIVKYITVIPEKWTAQKFHRIGDNVGDMTNGVAKSNTEDKVSYSSEDNVSVVETGAVTYYSYYAGENTQSEANRQYEGWHVSMDKESNWMPSGLYMAPGRMFRVLTGQANTYRKTADEVVLKTPPAVGTKLQSAGWVTVGPFNQ